ncbi:MAG: ATP-binding cassette domain-containing protein, partial [Flavobacteriales bacterium]
YTDFNLDIKKGEKIVLKAPSGKGKSTLINQILGFIEFEEGSIEVFGKRVSETNIHEIRSMTGWLPQETGQFNNTAHQMLIQPFLYKSNKDQYPTKQKITDTLKKFRLQEGILHKNSYDISGGELQRLLLCSIYMLNKPLILLDEPTSALDAENAEVVRELFLDLDTTVVIATHDDSWSEKVDRVVVLEEGG